MQIMHILRYLGVFILCVILIISMGLIAGIRNGNNVTTTEFAINGISEDIEIYRDEYGVPTIIGQTLKDVLFGQGYAFAQDRSFQLEFYRSLINGELAALFGPDLLETDKVLRTVGLKRAAERMINKLTQDQLDLVSSYVRGINTYYDQNRNNKPFELEILGKELKEWEITDTIAMGSIVAFTFAFGGLNDEIRMLKVMDQVGIQDALELRPVDYQPAFDYLNSQTEIYYPNLDNPDSDNTRLGLSSMTMIDAIRALEPILGEHMEVLEAYMSNNWVVSKDKSATGNPILANDPHTSLEAQGLWHRVNLMTTDGEILLQGFNFPGTPLLGFGHNKNIVWGVTSGIMDSVDLYYLKSNNTHYLYNGDEWKEFETLETIIEVRGTDPVTYTARFSEFGPMIMTELGELAMQWTLNEDFERDNPIKSLIDLNLATSIDDMHVALEHMLTGFNWVIADVNTGDIAYQQSGLIPDRKEGYGLIPKNGSAPNQGWNGLVPYEDQLYVINPVSGYFATANERVDDRDTIFVSENYAPRHRDDRIEQVLANATDFEADPNAFTLEDMQKLQTDVKTLVAEDLIDPVKKVFTDYRASATDLEILVIDELLTWDQRLTLDSVAGLVFSTYRLFIIDNTLGDEIGDLVTEVAGTRILTDWYREGIEASWFDDITTANIVEDSADMAIATLQRSVSFLESRYGSDLSNWQWGDKHRVSLPHTFSGILPFFDIGGQPAIGSSNTVNAIAGPRFNNGDLDFTSSYGPYFRLTVDVESTWDDIWVIVSSGASGNPLSPHYADAYQTWNLFEYYKWHSSLQYITDYFKLVVIIRRA